MINEKIKLLHFRRTFVVMAAILYIVPYAIYHYYHYYMHVDLDRLYFITSSLATIMISAACYSLLKDIYTRTASIWICAFYSILLLLYMISGLVLGSSYVYTKWALIAGTLIGLIYWIYDYFTGVKP
jgi:uncharacterized membrane protein